MFSQLNCVHPLETFHFRDLLRKAAGVLRKLCRLVSSPVTPGVQWLLATRQGERPKSDIELLIFLTLLPKCQDCRHSPLCSIRAMLEIKPRALYMLGKHVANLAAAQNPNFPYQWLFLFLKSSTQQEAP